MMPAGASNSACGFHRPAALVSARLDLVAGIRVEDRFHRQEVAGVAAGGPFGRQPLEAAAGGQQLTGDISRTYGIPTEEAEQKKRSGDLPADRMVTLRSLVDPDAPYTTNEQMITKLFRIKNVEVEPLRGVLQQLVSKDGDTIPYPPDTIIVNDVGVLAEQDVVRAFSILKATDLPSFLRLRPDSGPAWAPRTSVL